MAYYYEHVIGSFLFDKNWNITAEGSKEDIAKNKAAVPLPADKVKDALFVFRQRHEEMRLKNIAITKQQVKSAVGPDTFILQASASIQELERIVNTVAKRLREWYENFNPELSHDIGDPLLLSHKIITAHDATTSMGAPLKKEEKEELGRMAKHVVALAELKAQQEKYLERILNANYPNLMMVAGASISAKLLSEAGSMKRLAMMPATRLQVLGAERAMFRHVRNKKARPPKYGVISQHAYFASLKKKVHGRMARALADKISLACKVDFFKGKFIGDRLHAELEKKLKQLQ